MKKTIAIFTCLIVSAVVTISLKASDVSVLNSIIWNLLGVLGGVLIAAVTFFLTAIDGVQRRVIRGMNRIRPLSPEAREVVEAKFDGAVSEIRQNIFGALILIMLSVLCVLWSVIDLPWVYWPSWSPVTKIQVVHGVSVCILLLVFATVWDTLAVMFRLRELDRNSEEYRD